MTRKRASPAPAQSQVKGHAPLVTVAPTVANFGGGSADAARILKAIKMLHAAFGEDMPSEYRAEVTVPIPVGIVDAVIDILARTAKGAREARSNKAQKARELRDKIRNEQGCSKLEAARRATEKLYPNAVGAEFNRRWNTIYRSK